MRIAVVDLLFNWPPEGGARVDVYEICKRLASEHEVCLFCPSFNYHFPRGQIRTELPFPVHGIPFKVREFNAFTLPRRFKAEIQEFSPDLVFIADGWYLKPYLVKALSSYPIILRFYAYEMLCLKKHGLLFRDGKLCNIDYLKGGWRDYLTCLKCSWDAIKNDPQAKHFRQEWLASAVAWRNYPKLVKEALRITKTIIVYNSIAKERLHAYNDKVQIIPTGIDPTKFSAAKGKKKKKGEPVIFLMAGRINDETKGFAWLREAARQLWLKRKDFRLRVTSEDSFDEEFIQAIGWQPAENMPQAYAEADVLITPSLWHEPCGISTLEAMAGGLPVIASNLGGLKENITDSETGFLVEPYDTESLLQKMQLFLNDPELISKMGKAAQQKATQNFAWDVIFEKYYRSFF